MENRQRILDAAARVYGEVGFRGATTRRIAAEAGVNEVTLFRIFGSKASLLTEALRCCGPSTDVRPELPTVPVDPARELIAWATAHIDHLERNGPLIRTMMGEFDERPEVGGVLCDAPRQTNEHVAAYIARLRRDGWIDAEVSPKVAAAMFLGALFGDVMGRDLMPDVYSLGAGTAARQYVQMFLRGLGYRPARADGRERGAMSPARRGPARATKRSIAPAESGRRRRS